MIISEMALNLLRNGRFNSLQELPYHQLLSDDARGEVVKIFKERMPNVHESTGLAVHDPILLSTLSEACVVSSGQVYSKSVIDDLFRAAVNGEARCPLTRSPLSRDIAGPGQYYVLLPKLDEAIQFIRQLRAVVIRRITEAARGSFVRRALVGALNMQPIGEDREYEPRNSAQVFNDPTGSVQLLITQGILKLIFKTDRFPVICQTLLNDYLHAELPAGKVDARKQSYTMDPLCFGRCWQRIEGSVLELDLWFPSASYLPVEKQTFGDSKLIEIQGKIERLLNIQPLEFTGDFAPTHSVATLEWGPYVPVINETSATFTQMFLCARAFLDYTQKFAQRLEFPVKDEVEASDLLAAPARISDQGFFGSSANVGSTSSVSTSAAHRK